MRTEVYTTKTYHDSFDPIRAIRTKEYSYIENYASRPLLDLPWDIAESAPGRTVAPLVLGERRPERELYDLVEDPTESHNLLGPDATDKAEAIANDLALLLERLAPEDQRRHTVRIRGHPNCGALHRNLSAHSRSTITSRSAIAAERGIEDDHSPAIVLLTVIE